MIPPWDDVSLDLPLCHARLTFAELAELHAVSDGLALPAKCLLQSLLPDYAYPRPQKAFGPVQLCDLSLLPTVPASGPHLLRVFDEANMSLPHQTPLIERPGQLNL